MKRVVKEMPKSEFIVSSACSINKYYGISKHASNKGFITATKFTEDATDELFVHRSVSCFTGGNGWTNTPNQMSLLKILNLVLKDGFDVYEFDTPEEFFTWLAKP